MSSLSLLKKRSARPFRVSGLLLAGLLFTGPGALEAAENAVEVQAVEVGLRALVEELPVSGTASSEQVSQLSAQVDGLVQQVYVDVGDQVQAGTVLLAIDEELRQLERARLQAEANRARAQWDDSQRQFSEAERLKEAIAGSEVRRLQAMVQVAEAQWQAADAAVRQLDAMLERHRLQAPFSGTLIARMAEAGEWVTPGVTLFELVSTSPLRIDFQVPQRYFARIDQQTRARLGFDAYPGRVFEGEILRKVPLSQEGSRTFMLQVRLAAEDTAAVIPGMSVSGVLQLDANREGIAVPRDAVVRYPNGRTTVWVLSEARWNEVVQVREASVQLGEGFSGMVEVLSGLEAGEIVISRGNEALQEGQQVRAQQVDYEGLPVSGSGS